MDFTLLNHAVFLDFALKCSVTIILFLVYIENKNKMFMYWAAGWLFLTIFMFFEHLLLFSDSKSLWLFCHLAWALSSICFFCGIYLSVRKKNYYVYLTIFTAISFLSAWLGLYHYNSWFLSALPTAIINGSILILSGYSYYRLSINKRLIYNKLISLGFILSGLHNLDYPFLRNIKWFAPLGFFLSIIFVSMFALGMILKSEAESKRQKRVNLEHIRELATRYAITSTVCRSNKLDQILYAVLDNVIRILKLDAGCIFLVDNDSNFLLLKVHRGISKKLAEKLSKTPRKKTETDKAITENRIIFIENISKSNNPDKKILLEDGLCGFTAVPLRSGNKVLGTINIATRSPRVYSSQDARLLDSIGNELGVAIDNKQLAGNLEKVYLSTILTLTDIVEAKDHYTRSHSDYVARYAVMTAQELKLPEKEIEKIRMASQLHDLGKIAISDFILLKKGKLNDKEWEEVKKHPDKAVEILSPLTFLHQDNGVLEYIRGHHERYDGHGYPNGYKENQIKLGARILAIADAYHAMVSSRPYRKKPLTLEKAREEIILNSGSQFDPEVASAFLTALEKEEKSHDKY